MIVLRAALDHVETMAQSLYSTESIVRVRPGAHSRTLTIVQLLI